MCTGSDRRQTPSFKTLKRIGDNPIGTIPIIYITEKQLELFMRYMTRYSNSVIAKTHQQLKLAYELAIDTYADVFNRMNNDAMKKFEDYSSKLAI